MRIPSVLGLGLGLSLLSGGSFAATTTVSQTTPVSRPTPTSSQTAQDGLVSLTLSLDREAVAPSSKKPLHAVAELEVIGGERPDRKPLALSIVLDVSGSMEGENKLKNVVQATQYVLDRLGKADRVAIVAYETGTHSVYLPEGAPDAEAGRRALEKLRPLGGTNMEAGLRLGLEKLGKLGGEKAARRLLLLSDGQANQGISSQEGLSKIAATAREMGASVSTFGVGADYNEDLMAAIAEAAGGNYHVIDRGKELAEVFQKEFDELGSLVGSQVALGLELPAGLELEEAYGYPIEKKDGQPRLVLRDLYHGMKTKVVLRFRVAEKAPEKGDARLVGRLSFADARDASQKEVVVPVSFHWSPDPAEEAKTADPRIVAIVEEVEGARELEEATRAYAAGKLEEAQKLIQKRIAQNQSMQEALGEDASRLEAQNQFLQKTLQTFDATETESRSGRAAVKEMKQGARMFRY